MGTSPTTTDLFGHPRGLAVLFATEAFERFSYFGNAALLVLYMVKYLFEPARFDTVLGLGALRTAFEFVLGPLAPQPFASQLFGLYTGLAYSMPVLGGLLADRLIGARRSVLLGGVLMATGHFLMAFETLLLLALLLLIVGIGALKPNISSQVGALYATGDERRDRAYSIFYLGINIGAFLAPLVCGALAAAYGWHLGFAAAGIGMLVSLCIYIAGARTLPDAIARVSEATPGPRMSRAKRAHSGYERRAVFSLLAVCAIAMLFWAAYDQQGNTVLLWAEDFTDRSLHLGPWRGEIPSPWFLALNPLLIFFFTPLIVRRWAAAARDGREPSATAKMAFGGLCLAAANLTMALAAWCTSGKASPAWLLAYFGLATLGELHLAPVGLALISREAPARMLSMLMGAWFAATLPADIFGGFLGGFWSSMAKWQFFLLPAALAALAALALWTLSMRAQPPPFPPPQAGEG